MEQFRFNPVPVFLIARALYCLELIAVAGVFKAKPNGAA